MQYTCKFLVVFCSILVIFCKLIISIQDRSLNVPASRSCPLRVQVPIVCAHAKKEHSRALFVVRDEGLCFVCFADSPSCAGSFSLLGPVPIRQCTALPHFTALPFRVQVPILCTHTKTEIGEPISVFVVRDEGLEPPRSPART